MVKEPTKIPGGGESSNKPKLLILDDDERTARGLARHLKKHFDVSVFHSFEDAQIAMRATQFSRILSDHDLGTLGTGVDFLRFVADHYPNTHRVFHSGDDLYAIYGAEKIDSIAHRVLRKPVDADELILALLDVELHPVRKDLAEALDRLYTRAETIDESGEDELQEWPDQIDWFAALEPDADEHPVHSTIVSRRKRDEVFDGFLTDVTELWSDFQRLLPRRYREVYEQVNRCTSRRDHVELQMYFNLGVDYGMDRVAIEGALKAASVSYEEPAESDMFRFTFEVARALRWLKGRDG